MSINSNTTHPCHREARRCLICREPGQVSINAYSVFDELKRLWSQSCITSICRLLEIPKSHPFKHFFLNASYCQDCLQLLQDIDFSLKQIDNFQQQLIGFRQDIYRKVGDNYEAVPSKDKLAATYNDLEIPNEVGKLKRIFAYDEVVKMLYEKIAEEESKENYADIIHNPRSRRKNKNPVLTRVKKENQVDQDTSQNETYGSSDGNRRLRSLKNKNQNSEIIEASIEPSDSDDSSAENPRTTEATDPDWSCSEDEGIESEIRDNQHALKQKEKVPFSSSKADVCTEIGPFKKFERFSCNEEGCPYLTTKEYLLAVHKRKIHEGDLTPYHCDLCEMKYKTSKGLDLHKLSLHEGNQRFLCTVCGTTVKTEDYLRVHMRRVHDSRRQSKPHKCRFCGMKSGKESQLLEHENLHLNTEEPFTCVVCNIALSNSTDLRHHFEKSHSGNPNTCEICGKQFSQPKSLQNHKKIHDESFVGHKCQDCGVVFSTPIGLKLHMPKHTNEKKYNCSICGEGFKYYTTLSRHKRKHNAEYPFQCRLCDKKFAYGHSLQKHEQTHSSILSYQCTVCPKAFKTKTNLNQHTKTHDPNRIKKVRHRIRSKRMIVPKDDERGSSDTEGSSSPKISKRPVKTSSGSTKKRNKLASNLLEYSDSDSGDNYLSNRRTRKGGQLNAEEEIQSAISSIPQEQNQHFIDFMR